MSDELYSPSWYRIAELKPQLRSHCQVHRHNYRNEIWYVLQNPVSGRFHRFSPNAYLIIGLMNGIQSMQAIWDTVVEKLGDDVPTQQEIIQLLTQLYRADAIQTGVMPVIKEMQDRGDKMQRQKTMQHLRSPLSIKIPLFDPDALLTTLLPYMRVFFTPTAVVIWLMFILMGLLFVGQYWLPLTENVIDRALSLENLLLLWFVFPIVKGLHELGHGLAVKYWGGEVHELGLMFLIFMPVPYVDASDSSGFQQKHRRIFVAAAGLIVELFLAVLALILWVYAEPGMVRAVAFNVILIAGVSAIVFNGNPLLRYDSYYMLSDFIEIPNFGARANQYIAYLIQKYIFKVPAAISPVMAEGEAGWFFFYSIASFCYRMVMMTSIILMIGGQYFIVGVILALWSLYSMLLQPIYKSTRSLLVSPQITPVRGRAILIVCVVLIITSTFLMLVPISASVRTEGVVWAPEKTLVRPEVEGHIINVVVSPGSYVESGEVLIEISNLQLLADVEIYQAQLQALAYRFDQELVSDFQKAQITRDEMVAINAMLTRANERIQSLQIRSSKAGRFTVEQAEDLPGRYVRRGEVLAYVIAFDDAKARVVVNQDQADLVRKADKKVEVRFVSAFDDVIDGHLQQQVPAATDEIPSAVLTTEGGGEYATVTAEKGLLKSTQRMFQFEVMLETEFPIQHLGERVYIKFIRPPEPLGFQIYRTIRQLFLSRFDV